MFRFPRSTRDSTLAETDSENRMEKDTVVEFLGTWRTVPASAFLINGCSSSRPGMPEFPAGHIPCILRVYVRLQRKSRRLRHSLSNFQFNSPSRFLFPTFQTFLHLARFPHSPLPVLFSFPPPWEKLNFSRIEIQLNVAQDEIEVL